MRLSKKRKAQIQMMETIGVLFIFFILVLFGLIFYFRYQQISLDEQQQELVAQAAMDITLTTLFLPEVQCTRGVAEAEDNCIDLMKLRTLNETMSKYVDDYYFNLFGFAKIYVVEVGAENETNATSWTIYDREKLTYDESTNSSAPDWTFREPTYFIVTLRDEIQGNPQDSAISRGVYSVGYLVVEAYS